MIEVVKIKIIVIVISNPHCSLTLAMRFKRINYNHRVYL